MIDKRVFWYCKVDNMSVPPKTTYLKAKIQIGNTKGPLNYDGKQVVFHHDDVPETRRQRKHEVLEWKRKKIVGPEHHQWDISSNPNNPPCVRRAMENHVHDRSHKYEFNFRAETVDPLRNVPPVEKSTKFHVSSQLASTAKEIMTIRANNPLEAGRFHRTLELPVNPNLADMPAWNNTTVLTLQDQSKGLHQMTDRARAWTAEVSSTLSQRKKYHGPMASTRLLQEEIRQKKRDGEFSVKDPLISTVKPIKPESPRNHYLNEKPLKSRTTVHTGVWETSKVDGRLVCSLTFKLRKLTFIVSFIAFSQTYVV